jgi:hypothetical protein
MNRHKEGIPLFEKEGSGEIGGGYPGSILDSLPERCLHNLKNITPARSSPLGGGGLGGKISPVVKFGKEKRKYVESGHHRVRFHGGHAH